jgi:hypothetical protein
MSVRRFKTSRLTQRKQYGVLSGRTTGLAYVPGSFVTSMQNSSYPHSHDFTQATNKTGGNNAWGFSQETTSDFGIHYSPSPVFPAHLAIYFGDAYPNGVQIEAVRFVAHLNHFSTFEVQGSNNSGKSTGFATTGSWTTIASGSAPCTSEFQVFDFESSYLDFYTAIRLQITNGEIGGSGLASYYWRLGGRTREIAQAFAYD